MVGQNVREKATRGLSLVGIRRRQRSSPSKKRGLTMKTVDKWIVDNDKTLNTTTWLKYDKVDREYVATLKCSVCFRFNDKLRSARNYNSAFVVGSTNLRASAFKEHAASDMHLRAMTLLMKSLGSALVEYSPIAKMLSTLDDDAEPFSIVVERTQHLRDRQVFD